jgi:hypothetical protein
LYDTQFLKIFKFPNHGKMVSESGGPPLWRRSTTADEGFGLQTAATELSGATADQESDTKVASFSLQLE